MRPEDVEYNIYETVLDENEYEIVPDDNFYEFIPDGVSETASEEKYEYLPLPNWTFISE